MQINIDWVIGSLLTAATIIIGFFLTQIYFKVDKTHDFIIKQEEKNDGVKIQIDDHEQRITSLEGFQEQVKVYHYNNHGELIK